MNYHRTSGNSFENKIEFICNIMLYIEYEQRLKKIIIIIIMTQNDSIEYSTRHDYEFLGS